MQNFTLRFKGRMFYLLTLALLFGSLPSIYGQCPTVTDSTQEYCGLDRVSDLQATDPDTSDGNTIRWYDSQTDLDPIPSNETLENGKSYFAGYQNGSCVNQRAEVTVNITTPGAPKLGQGEDEFYTPCEIAGTHTVADLKAGIEFQDQAGYTLEYFDNQFDESAPLPDNFQLVEGNSYFAGFVDNNDANCQSNRTPIKYDPVEAPAPAADNTQTVCQGTTVSELEAEGTNRWYRTSTSQPPLADDFVVENGKTYYATQIIPSDGPPCESEERTAVTVTVLDPDPGTDNSETLCENEVDDNGYFDSEADLRAYYVNLLGAGDSDGSFDPSLATLISNYNDGITSPSEDFTTEYTVTKTGSGGETCEESATATLTVNKAEAPNTGDQIADQMYCTNEGVQDLYALLSNDANPNGVFSSPSADVADGNFDPEAEGPGTYDITYTVSPATACVSGTASQTFEIEVNQAPNAGPGGEYTFCQEQFETLIAAVLANPMGQGQELLDEIDSTIDNGGTFTNSDLMTLAASYNPSASTTQTFTTTYTVSNSDCTDSAEYTIIITPNEQAEAGEGNEDIVLCTTDDPRTLESFLSGNAMEGGEFSSDDFDVSSGEFDPAAFTTGEYTFTYTVDGDDKECVVGEDTADFKITLKEAPDAGNSNSTVLCTEDLSNNPFEDEDELEALYLSLLDNGVATDGTFYPTMQELINEYNNSNGTGDFTTTYTIGDDCTDSVELTVEVRDNIEADLSEVADPAPICQNAGVQDLYDYIEDNPTIGRFPDYPNGEFNPGTQGAGDYVITYVVDEETPCVTGSDSIDFTITVTESAFAGGDVSLALCTNSSERDLFLALGQNVDKDGTFTLDGDEIPDGKFDPQTYGAGEYEVIYSVASQNDCGGDTSTFTITVNQATDAGDDLELTICQNEVDFNLYTLLASDIDKNGTFFYNGEIIQNGLLNPSDFEAGDFQLEYITLNSNCSDSANLDLTIRDAANAGEDMDLSVCMNDGVQDLYTFLSVNADTSGDFTLDGNVIADGLMDPMDFEADTYEVVYTVAAINDCGDDTSTFSITVNETPDAPGVSDLNFCKIQSPTSADLIAEGTNLTFYSDEALSMMVMEDENLMTGTYYVTQRTDENGCESDAASIEVFVGDAATPTIDNTNQTFCKYDDATIADLTAALNENSNITWFETENGNDSYSTSTPLQNGVTYYASLYDPETDCDSSNRLAVSVTIEDCPLLFPEGISPNGDGLNDTFDIKNIEREYPNYNITIHNRWGDVVYKGNANSPKWNGFTNQSGSFGDDVSTTGVYFYILDFNDGSTPPRRGKIYLSR
ncbi:gliding motility-associated C-terminal domain-containing protein [Christiangramia salexigens]|uniref:Ig-like domain-containing protein n=1 Tax=Christiangramia salexigens TaxID=1913577 RepID=A0A1L3J7P0_9FLAO|nr:gliding motility-associated C-terminal domain-containing protein [Christiangramia salexigens]APG61138.1 hypothetical protein LPB144_12330 [Christiangramia salexigens]